MEWAFRKWENEKYTERKKIISFLFPSRVPLRDIYKAKCGFYRVGRPRVPMVLFTFFLEFSKLLGCTAAAMLPQQARGTLRKHTTKPWE